MSALEAYCSPEFEKAFGLSNWKERAVPAFNDDGSESFRDANGELIEGIYLGMPNDLYHSLPALSSSGLKKFCDSPALYAREYLSSVNRKRTTQMKHTFDAGTYGHELCLEAEGFYDRYFRDLVPADCPDAMDTVADIEKALVAAGLSASESKDDKIARLLRYAPATDTTTLKTLKDIDAALEAAGQPKSESKLEKARRLMAANPLAEVFELVQQQNRDKHGAAETLTVNGEQATAYGGKLPIDGVVWDDAHRVQASVRSHSQANAIIQNGEPEVAILALCPLTKLWLKVKFDWLRFDDEAADVKTTLSSRPEDFKRQISKLNYDIQLAFYSYVAELVGITIKRFSMIAVEYVNADICQPYELGLHRIVKARQRLDNSFKNYVECTQTGKWWGWSKEDCVMVLD
ncbi:PD-(D/E)XK nuclease-like domain-containing protein [Rheinheimera hassiensis]|uniref:PD-(D/E)XK nuclease-like domain-containing protein n=1 Tax=Rheinheimera hassiensis TaxID=1193627 RepID=UPI001F0696F9|nr:PD-(D/E)XK nuclease-like domain-containing protein [Rheinheimera hassiensis]